MIAETAERVIHQQKPRPDAIIAWNDTTALKFLDVIRKCDDDSFGRPIAVTGWDDSPYLDMLELTSVRMPMCAMGECAAQRIYERLEEQEPPATPVRKNLPLELVPRASSTQ